MTEPSSVDMDNLLVPARLMQTAAQHARAELLSDLSDLWSMAVQADLENGVAALNEQAAVRFTSYYPAITDFGKRLCDLAMEATESLENQTLNDTDD